MLRTYSHAQPILKKYKDTNGFDDIFSEFTVARRKLLQKEARTYASYAKKTFTTHIGESLTENLTTATRSAVKKMGLDHHKITPHHLVRMLLLRTFARENPTLLHEDANKVPRHNISSDVSKTPKPRTTDKSFWGVFMVWLESLVQKNGANIKDEKWKKHVIALLKTEEELHPEDTIEGLREYKDGTTSASAHPQPEPTARPICALPPSLYHGSRPIDINSAATCCPGFSVTQPQFTSTKLPPLRVHGNHEAGLTLPGLDQLTSYPSMAPFQTFGACRAAVYVIRTSTLGRPAAYHGLGHAKPALLVRSTISMRSLAKSVARELEQRPGDPITVSARTYGYDTEHTVHCRSSTVRTFRPYFHTLIFPVIPGRDMMELPMYAFLVQHGQRKVMFDLGIRKDPLNFVPSLAAPFASGQFAPSHFDTDIFDLLGQAGIAPTPSSIESVIWSHAHFDHIGDMSKFPNTTSLVIGSETDVSTYPTNPNATLQESDFASA
ncbi:Metallo-beta-lactamase superfamily protein [Mycena indigotica]|uniref:Metallo-beta-lactamase superfamily protein n=1 Tax=Mycena indigotica TaxID=2126181 RepID=A0A8H6SH40_9AGAR|nr:Metallo-beta-lactamase superfamily protein [Mycena indigotica]KAF7299510.1 Metallo-beta-lactamase superfamily protein [Mycena indigotica]